MNETEYMDYFFSGKRAQWWDRTGAVLQMVGAFMFAGAFIYETSTGGMDVLCSGNWFILTGFVLWMVGAIAAMHGSVLRLKMSEKMFKESLARIKKEYGHDISEIIK